MSKNIVAQFGSSDVILMPSDGNWITIFKGFSGFFVIRTRTQTIDRFE